MLPTPKYSRPNVLDSPRFFDDSALSEWKDTDAKRSVAAPKSSMRLQPLWNVVPEGDQWPEPTNEGDPITVELVRGADGPMDDGWHVVVDGLRCKLKEEMESTASGNELKVFKCQLPGGVARKILHRDSVVRQLLLGVRLEDEAAMPLEVTLETRQVLVTDEMHMQPPGVPIVKSISTTQLSPYRVSEPKASVMQLPYPVHVAAQSALSVVSFEKVKRWEDQARAARFYNIAIDLHNASQIRLYLQQKLYYEEQLEESRQLESLTTSVGGVFQIVFPGTSDAFNLLRSTTRRLGSRLPKPTAPKEIGKKFPPQRPSVGLADEDGKANTKDFVIGGGTKSAARELCDMFNILTEHALHSHDIVQKVHDDLNLNDEKKKYRINSRLQLPNSSESQSLKYKLHCMRQTVLSIENGKTAALFDALLTSEPYPLLKQVMKTMDSNTINNEYINEVNGRPEVLIDGGRFISTTNFSRRYNVCGDGEDTDAVITVEPNAEARIAPLSEEERKEFQESIDQERKNEEKRARDSTSPFMFLYERVPLNRRLQTVVKVVYRVKVIHEEGEEFVVDFESQQEDGAVANAVYSGHVADVLDFDESASFFVDSMFAQYTTRGVVGVSKDVWNKIGVPVPKRVPTGWKDAYKMIFADSGNFKLENFIGNLDPCLIEERVAELRLMIRSILPLWPPPSTEVQEDDVEQLTEFYLASQESPQVEAQPTNPAAELDEMRATTREDNFVSRTEAGERRKNVLLAISLEAQQQKPLDIDEEQQLVSSLKGELKDKLTNIAQMKSGDYNEETIRSMVMDATEIVKQLNERAFLGDSSQRAFVMGQSRVKRVLPQILVPAKSPSLRFQLPDNPDPPPNYDPRGVDPASQGVLSSIFSSISFSSLVWFGLKAAAATGLATVATGLGVVAASVSATNAGVAAVTGDSVAVGAGTVGLFNIVQGLGQYARAFGLITSSTISASGLIRRLLTDVRMRLGFQMIKHILTLEEVRRYGNAARIELCKTARRNLRMIPVASCITAARASIKLYNKGLREFTENAGLSNRGSASISVSYSRRSMQRLRFCEYYIKKDGQEVASEEDVVELHGASDWSSVPDGTCLRVFPPVEVSDALYETLVHRRIPVDKAIMFAVGKSNSERDTSPAAFAARAAFMELLQAIFRSRRNLKGEHVMKSTSQTALELVEHSSKLLVTAYGVRSGVTLVHGDDAVWTCFPGGVVARLSLRHFAVFAKSEDARLKSTNFAVSSFEYWKERRRYMVEAFASAMVEEARFFARQQSEKSVIPFPDSSTVKNMAIEASRAFSRTAAMSSQDNAGIVALVVASSTVHKLWFSSIEDTAFKQRVLSYITQEHESAATFRDQVSLEAPTPSSKSLRMTTASWASRRLDARGSRDMVLGKGNANEIINKLASISMEETSREQSEDSVYYCPMGSRGEALPGKLPFDIDHTSNRVVWLKDLCEAALYVKNSLRSEEYKTGESFVGIEAESLGSNNASTTGISRHPLTLVVKHSNGTHNPIVYVGLCKHTMTNQFSESFLYKHQTLKSAMKFFEDFNDTSRSIQTIVSCMREMAYNSERLFHCLSLANSFTHHDNNKILISLNSAKDACALSVALAMYATDTGNFPPSMKVLLPEKVLDEADLILNEVQNRSDAAYHSGCKVGLFSEVCLCMS